MLQKLFASLEEERDLVAKQQELAVCDAEGLVANQVVLSQLQELAEADGARLRALGQQIQDIQQAELRIRIFFAGSGKFLPYPDQDPTLAM